MPGPFTVPAEDVRIFRATAAQWADAGATFNDVGDSLTLIAGANSKWIVVKEQGIALS